MYTCSTFGTKQLLAQNRLINLLITTMVVYLQMAGLLKSAFVVGYTGAVGRDVVKALVDSKRFEKVVLIGRRKVEYEDPAFQELVTALLYY